jgi:glycerol-3-phosphate dehydrogenase
VAVEARAVVNATGPWIDALRRLEDPGAPSSVRLSKGVHVFLELTEPWTAALTVPHDKVRVSFAVPWEGMLLLGTTDTPYDQSPDELAVTEEDIQAVIAEAAVALEPDALRLDAVKSTSAGLRVLPHTRGPTTRARRETVLLRGRAGMLTVAGGKLTTYRRIALQALAALGDDLGLRGTGGPPVPLPGAAGLAAVTARLARSYPQVEPETRAHLAHLYGLGAEDVLSLGARDPELLEPLAPGGPDIAAQAVYAREREWACTVEDVLFRRTTVGRRGLEPKQGDSEHDEHRSDQASRTKPLFQN